MRKLLACAVLMSLSACGIPIEAEPEVIGLEIEPPLEIDEPAPEDLTSVSIYLVRNDNLIHATRDLPTPATAQVILDSLLDGVTDPEERAGLRTSIPPGTDIVELTQDGLTLRLNLSRDFTAVGGEEEIQAVAQIVLTATSFEGVELVSFAIEGVPTNVPVADGALAERPVQTEDYLGLLGS